MEYNFTNKDIALLREISKGYTYKEIARTMNLSPRTIEWRTQKIMKGTKCGNKVELVNYFRNYLEQNNSQAKKHNTIWERIIRYIKLR